MYRFGMVTLCVHDITEDPLTGVCTTDFYSGGFIELSSTGANTGLSLVRQIEFDYGGLGLYEIRVYQTPNLIDNYSVLSYSPSDDYPVSNSDCELTNLQQNQSQISLDYSRHPY